MLIGKDFGEIFRNRLTLVITILIIIMLPLWYHFMPSEVEESLHLAVRAPGLEGVFDQINASDEALQISRYNDTEALKGAVENGDVMAGIILPPDFVQTLLKGEKPEVDLYFSSVVPEDAREPIKALFEELSFKVTGQVMPVSLNTEIIGKDYAGEQLPFRDQAKPLWISLVLLVEMMALAFLIIEEKQTGAINAILVTPTTASEVFTAKTVVGTVLTSVEAGLVLTLMGEIGAGIVPVMMNIVLGAILVTGFAFLIATPARDLKSSFSWIMIPYIVFMVPPMTVIYPQVASPLVKVLPSFYLADTFNKVLNQGAGLGGVWMNLAILAAFDVVILLVGAWVLRRRIR